MSQTGNRLYSQIEIIILSKLPPTTVKRWLDYFSDLVPSIRKGDLDYYQFETLELLRRISELRNEKFRLNTIRRLLMEEGFDTTKKIPEEGSISEKVLQKELQPEMLTSLGPPHAIMLSLSVLADELYKIAQELEVICRE